MSFEDISAFKVATGQPHPLRAAYNSRTTRNPRVSEGRS